MSSIYYNDNQVNVEYLVDHSIIAYPNSIFVVAACKFLAAGWAGIVSEERARVREVRLHVQR